MRGKKVWGAASIVGLGLVAGAVFADDTSMKSDQPVGDYEDFLTGFIVDNGNVWGRPVATTELKDGSLLLSDDGANVIYRISYAR